jgi:hypothetical protein
VIRGAISSHAKEFGANVSNVSGDYEDDVAEVGCYGGEYGDVGMGVDGERLWGCCVVVVEVTVLILRGEGFHSLSNVCIGIIVFVD